MKKGNKEKIVSEIQQRLIEICQTYNVSMREFSRNIGKSESYLSSLNKDITAGVLNDILSIYPMINSLWLITGKGDKFISPEPTDALFQHLKEENKELKLRNEELNRELGKFEEQLSEFKKGNAQMGISADSADVRPCASGTQK